VPEGDTVWMTCHLLDRALAGQRLTRCEFRVPALATTNLTGTVVTAVVPRGKHLLTRFDNGWTLHSHLRMDGSWRVFGTGRRWSGGPLYEVRAVLGVAAATAVGYRLPVLELIRTDQEPEVVGHLGPDLLGPDWDVGEAARRLAEQPDRSIGEALLDQRNLAGIGTVYRAEVLFLQGIHPRTPVRQVKDLTRLCERAHQLLSANKGTFDQVTTGNRRRYGTHWVYGRAGQPCRRCGTAIRKEEFGPTAQERLSYWCPHCQPLRPEPSKSAARGSAS
jgi:endonuclease-8